VPFAAATCDHAFLQALDATDARQECGELREVMQTDATWRRGSTDAFFRPYLPASIKLE
jgi:hypothetical protein